MIAAFICTRGLVFAETINSVLNNGATLFPLIVSKPIPEAQNQAVLDGLSSQANLIWFVEEDIFIPQETIDKMLREIADGADVVCVDYPVNGGWSTIKEIDGVIQHCGLGCTLIKRKVFEKISPPWFETDKSINADTGELMNIPMKYGGHDILFGIKVREHGFKIKQAKGVECQHLRSPNLVRLENNNDIYKIETLPRVTKKQNK